MLAAMVILLSFTLCERIKDKVGCVGIQQEVSILSVQSELDCLQLLCAMMEAEQTNSILKSFKLISQWTTVKPIAEVLVYSV